MGISCWITNINEKDRERYSEILNGIIELAHHEFAAIRNSGISKWSADQLEQIVIPEMNELLQYASKGAIFLKYGKQQRLLESTYLLTDSLNEISNTPLGIQIRKLQEMIDAV